NPELLSLLSQPEVLYGQIGELYEKHQEYGDAVKAYELAVERAPDNFDFQSRLTRTLVEAGDGEEAKKRAQALVSRFRANPDSLRQLTPMWSELLKPSRRKQLRLGVLQRLKVEPSAEASRLFWVSRVADLWNRDAMARSALEQGAAIKPAFAPIYRSLIGEYWARPDWEDSQKIAECGRLAKTVREQGDGA